MKIILVALAVLILAAVLFGVIGIISPGQSYETMIKINSPLEYTWKLYHDDTVLKEWVPGLQEIELQSGENATVGSSYILTMRDNKGKLATMNETITDFDENEKYAMDYSDKMLDGHVEVLFEAAGDSTIIRTINNYKGKTPLLRSMFHFFNGMIIKETEKQYEDFKSIAEKNFLKYQETQEAVDERIVNPQIDSLKQDEL